MIALAIVLNTLLSVAMTSAFYPVVGLAVFVIEGVFLTLGRNSRIAASFLHHQMRNWKKHQITFKERWLLMSVACLTCSMKIAAAIAIFVETGAALLLAFCLLLACGYFVEGAESGMTPVLSVRLARSAIKAFLFLSVGIDKIAEWTVKAELRILHIE